MSENNSEEISVQRIFDEISKYLKNEKIFERLQNILRGEQSYRLLLETGEKQFFDAPKQFSIEDEHRKARISYTTINYLAQQVENDIDKIVKEKFQGELLNNLKNEVLKAILQLSSDQISSTVKASPSSVKSKKGEQKPVLSLIENLSSSSVQNGSGMQKEHNAINQQSEESNITNGHAKSYLVTKLENGCIEIGSGEESEDQNVTNEQAESSNLTNGQAKSNWIKLENDKCDLDLMFTFDDVSSVHTSDLSSFEDEISVSSNEEFGEKRRLSLKEVQEKLENSQLEDMEIEENYKQVKNKQSGDAQCNSAVNGNESSKMDDQKWGTLKNLRCFNPLKKPNHPREQRGLRKFMPWMRSLFPEATELDKICGACRRQLTQLKKYRENNETLSMSTTSQDSFTVSQKSHRKRKPNLKYMNEEEIKEDLKKKSTEKSSKSSKSVCGDTPRKRGRPRKHST